MRDRKLDRLFDRYRKRGDATALGRVFDATAPEILEVAVHLVRDLGDAEDLLQATFLTAIEKAADYDADRRLVPWLIGILVRHAYAWRRKRGRVVDATRLPSDVLIGPAEEAQASELTDSIQQALNRLPFSYRSVLEPYLLRGERAVDIARSTGRAPATVRVQIRRGLIEFRRALPAGLVPGALVLTGSRSLADVRAVVLQSASTGVGTVALISLTSKTLIGVLGMSSKIVVASVGVLLFALLALIVSMGEGSLRDLNSRLETSSAPNLGPGSQMIAEESDLISELVARPEEASAGQPESAARKALAIDYRSALAGLKGRVLRADGSPAVGMPVTMLELRPSMIMQPLGSVFGGLAERALQGLARNPMVDTVRTNKAGEFLLRGAQLDGLHALGIDLGGAQPTWRIIDQALASAQVTDVGTITLELGHSLRGRVVDTQGRGLSGVRVRVARIPDMALLLGNLREGTHWIAIGNTGPMMIEISKQLVQIISNLPIPQTMTDASGEFELAHVTSASLATLVLDAPGFVVENRPLGGRESILKDIELTPLNIRQGRVVDSSGAPVVGAQVRCGLEDLAETGRGMGALCSTTQLTQAQGAFEFVGNANFVAVRRSATSTWTIVENFQDGDSISIPAAWSMTLHLANSDGEPIRAAEIQVTQEDLAIQFAKLAIDQPSLGEFEELEAGSYQVTDLGPGSYAIGVRAPGYAAGRRRLELARSGQTETLRLKRAGERQVTIVDASSHALIPGARATISDAQSKSLIYALGRSDATGRIELDGIPVKGDLFLEVTHPAYATSEVTQDDNGIDFTVALGRGEKLVFRLRSQGVPISTPMMLELTRLDAGPGRKLMLPTFGINDELGEITFSNVEAGRYYYGVQERYLNQNPLALLSSQYDAKTLAEGEAQLGRGKSTVIEIELDPRWISVESLDAEGGVTGRINISGQDPQGILVQALRITGNNYEAAGQAWLDAAGRFTIPKLVPGPHALMVTRPKSGQGNQAIAFQEFTAVPGLTHRIDIQLDAMELIIQILDAEGRPVEDCDLLIIPIGDLSPTVESLGDGGRRVTVWEAGEYRLIAYSHLSGVARESIQLDASHMDDVELRLDAGVPCELNFEFLVGQLPTTREFYVVCTSEGDQQLPVQFRATLNEDDFSLEIAGMQPDKLSVILTSMEGGKRYFGSFELPKAGARGLKVTLKMLGGGGGLQPIRR